MCKMKLPDLDKFSDKFFSAIKKSGEEQSFLTKWGIKDLSAVYDILRNNIQGGYNSHKHSILSTMPSCSVLTIGPGMGFCVFLLCELYGSVFVAEPDIENCCIINNISKHYLTESNNKANDVMRIYHAGLSITDEAIRYWNDQRTNMKKRNIKGCILNFVIKGAEELKDIFHDKVSRIYLHKVLSSLSISNSFENVISETALFLKDNGVISWAEPDYIFNDILQVNGQNAMISRLRSLFNNEIDFNVINYMVSSKINGNTMVENWVLLKAGRLLDGE